jgi:NADH-quinone oxidoreductase subunit J
MNLPWNLILFYVFAGVLVAAALGVISVRNSVHATLLLVLTFFTSAALWLLMQAEFLALALVLVYVGAVMVLFLFVVMMLDINTEQLREGYIRYLPVGILVAAVMLAEMLLLLGVKAMAIPAPADPGGASNTAWLGNALFTQYLLPFETAAVILTVAVIAAIMLTLRQRTNTRYQNPAEQVAVKARDRIRIVKMPSIVKMESSTVKEASTP